MKKLRVLFVFRSTEHYPYFESVIEALLGRSHQVKLLFDKGYGAKDLKFLEKKLQCENIQYSWAPRNESKLRKLVYYARDILSLKRYFMVSGQSRFYGQRWERILGKPAKVILKIPGVRQLILSDIVCKLLRYLSEILPVESKVEKEILGFHPDLVMASPVNMPFSSADFEYLRTAKQLSIPTALPIFSWDNLTTKGLFHLVPDELLVWNDTQVEEAIRHHQIPKSAIDITGSPFFDYWFTDFKPSLARLDFCKQLSLNPQFPILLYLGSSVDISGDESWLVIKLRDFLNSQTDQRLKNAQIIVRPHPHNGKIFEHIRREKIVVYPRQGVLPVSKNVKQDFFDCLYHSLSTVGVNTSAMIDSVILNKPTIALLTKEYRATQSQTEHFKQLVENKAVISISDLDDLKTILIELLQRKDKARKYRQDFVLNFIRPLGRTVKASERIVSEIEDLAKI